MPPRQSILSALAVLSLAACGQVSDPPVGEGDRSPAPARTFGAEEKRIAKSLSVGNQVASADASPEEAAMACSVAIGSIAEELLASNSLSAQQIRTLEYAEGVYRRRAAAGLSSADAATLRTAAEEAAPDEGERARRAIGCLRDLA